jgi:hypothetical protein
VIDIDDFSHAHWGNRSAELRAEITHPSGQHPLQQGVFTGPTNRLSDPEKMVVILAALQAAGSDNGEIQIHSFKRVLPGDSTRPFALDKLFI